MIYYTIIMTMFVFILGLLIYVTNKMTEKSFHENVKENMKNRNIESKLK